MIHVFSLPLNKLNVITLIFILFYRYFVSKHPNLIFKSLFLCEIISLPISTRVTREIKKDEKKEKERDVYRYIHGRCKIACFARGHAVDVFTSA